MGIHSEFEARLVYMVRSCLKKKENKDMKKENIFNSYTIECCFIFSFMTEDSKYFFKKLKLKGKTARVI
jgi:hypothetical protein